ncbi:thioesterase II family protein [Brevibacillus sp. SYSU BS000544]|uniref:thioesterase II family protein n=1 Tax=Brevibacillus sp. SYSU BS000544 TaxID=3416443 RepID=UPI003CE4F14C
MRKLKLFCIPQAGGTAAAYLKWKPYLHPSIELVGVELAGKGRRFSQPLYESVDEAVYDILSSIRKEISDCRYAIFGHSMGALLAFELLHVLKTVGLDLPVCTFFSGKNPPHQAPYKYRHLLNDEEFWCEIREIGGTPEEIFVNSELKKMFSPILRRDFKLVETYKSSPERGTLDCPFVVMHGSGDNLTSTKKQGEWAQYSKCKTTIHCFNGGHFFIFDSAEDVVNLVNKYLLKYVSPIV